MTDVLRRGLDSSIANWPVLALRLAETVLVTMLIGLTVVMVVVPLAISIGLSAAGLQEIVQSSETPAQVLNAVVAAHWLILIYILVAVSVALLVVICVHSFVMAASARTFVDGERAAGAEASPRQRFAVFTFERWMAGGGQGWWPVFWIYNIAYGIAAIVILLPLLPIALLILVLQQAAASIVLGCLALIIVVLMSIVVLIVTNIVCQKAIVLAAEKPIDGTTALRLGVAGDAHRFRTPLRRSLHHDGAPLRWHGRAHDGIHRFRRAGHDALLRRVDVHAPAAVDVVRQRRLFRLRRQLVSGAATPPFQLMPREATHHWSSCDRTSIQDRGFADPPLRSG